IEFIVAALSIKLSKASLNSSKLGILLARTSIDSDISLLYLEFISSIILYILLKFNLSSMMCSLKFFFILKSLPYLHNDFYLHLKYITFTFQHLTKILLN